MTDEAITITELCNKCAFTASWRIKTDAGRLELLMINYKSLTSRVYGRGISHKQGQFNAMKSNPSTSLFMPECI